MKKKKKLKKKTKKVVVKKKVKKVAKKIKKKLLVSKKSPISESGVLAVLMKHGML